MPLYCGKSSMQNHYRAKGWRGKWELIHWPPLSLFIPVPPRSLCGHYLQKWLLLTFLYAKNSNYIYLWQPGCCNLRTWTTGFLKMSTSLIWMEIEWKCKLELFSEWHCISKNGLHIMHFDYWMNNIIPL